jgi:hypothetical protein
MWGMASNRFFFFRILGSYQYHSNVEMRPVRSRYRSATNKAVQRLVFFGKIPKVTFRVPVHTFDRQPDRKEAIIPSHRDVCATKIEYWYAPHETYSLE